MQLQLIVAHDEVAVLENRHEQFQAWQVPRLSWLPLPHTGQRMLPRIGREGNLPSTQAYRMLQLPQPTWVRLFPSFLDRILVLWALDKQK